MRGKVKTLQRSNSLSHSVFSTAGFLGALLVPFQLLRSMLKSLAMPGHCCHHYLAIATEVPSLGRAELPVTDLR